MFFRHDDDDGGGRFSQQSSFLCPELSPRRAPVTCLLTISTLVLLCSPSPPKAVASNLLHCCGGRCGCLADRSKECRGAVAVVQGGKRGATEAAGGSHQGARSRRAVTAPCGGDSGGSRAGNKIQRCVNSLAPLPFPPLVVCCAGFFFETLEAELRVLLRQKRLRNVMCTSYCRV